MTWPDITYIVGVLSQFMQEPGTVHWLGVIQVLVYVKKALEMVICSLKRIQILAMVVREEIGNLLLDIAPILVEIWSRGVVKSRMLSLDLIRNLNIDLWLKLFMR